MARTVSGDQRRELASAALRHAWIARAPAVVAIAAVYRPPGAAAKWPVTSSVWALDRKLQGGFNDLLKADHAMAVQRLGELQNGLSSSEAEQSFSRLREGLKLHTEFENVVFYPTLRAAPGAGQPLTDLVRDHTQIQKLLSELSELDVTFPEWQDIIDEPMPMVERYAFKEETILFPIARQVSTTSSLKRWPSYQRLRNLAIGKRVNAHPER